MTRKADLRQSLIDMRRSKILEDLAQGLKVTQICANMNVSESTVKRDIYYLQRQSKENIRHFVEDRLIFEFDKALAVLDIVNRKCWELTANLKADGSSSNQTSTKRETLEALALIKDISKDRLEILTHGEMLRQCLKVSEKNNRNLQKLEAKYKYKSSTSTNGTAVSKQATDNARREEIEFNESEQEAEKTTELDTQPSEQSTHEVGESNGP